ncbi:MAG: DUF2062 domain-containing protein [Gammaproteobacteria bacterium]|nr:DUF2062 domain-containing protein [Gammaproteobacteria bacterium]
MPRKLIRKFMPHPKRITENPVIKKLGPQLQDPGIWHVNRRSISGAIAVGLFCAVMPIPFQMLLAALAAILFRVNILIAVPTVWVSNPFTIPPIFYFCYQVGVMILGTASGEFHFELTFDWLVTELQSIWRPFLLGCLVVASGSAFIGYFTVRFLWLYLVWKKIQNRKKNN